MKTYIIYQFLFPCGAVYIGCTEKSLRRRENQHRCLMERGSHGSCQALWDKHRTFSSSVLGTYTDKRDALSAERRLQQETPNCVNKRQKRQRATAAAVATFIEDCKVMRPWEAALKNGIPQGSIGHYLRGVDIPTRSTGKGSNAWSRDFGRNMKLLRQKQKSSQ